MHSRESSWGGGGTFTENNRIYCIFNLSNTCKPLTAPEDITSLMFIPSLGKNPPKINTMYSDSCGSSHFTVVNICMGGWTCKIRGFHIQIGDTEGRHHKYNRTQSFWKVYWLLKCLSNLSCCSAGKWKSTKTHAASVCRVFTERACVKVSLLVAERAPGSWTCHTHTHALELCYCLRGRLSHTHRHSFSCRSVWPWSVG